MTYAKTNLMLLLAWTSHLTASGLRFVVKVAVFSISFLSFIQHNRKSSLMSRTTRERRRSTPVSVRFADEPALVQVIGPMEPVRRVRFKIRTGVVSLNFFALCMSTVLAACTTCVFVGFVLLSCLIWRFRLIEWTSFERAFTITQSLLNELWGKLNTFSLKTEHLLHHLLFTGCSPLYLRKLLFVSLAPSNY